MPQIMKPHIRQTRITQQFLKLSTHTTWVIEITIEVTKHNVEIPPLFTRLDTRLLLALLMLFQSLNHYLWQRNFTPTCSCLRIALDVSSSYNRTHSTPYIENTLLKINITPSQREQLTTPHTCCESNQEQHLYPRTTRHL